MPYQPTLNFKLSDGRDLGNLGWITKEYLMTVYPQIANQLITPELWTWGRNVNGELGNNTSGGGSPVNSRSTPVTTFSGGANWKQVSVSNGNTSAIKTDGTLWTWGDNYSGTNGDNRNVNRSTPVTTFAGGTNWKQVASGNIFTVAIKTDGTLWTWGYNAYGNLGNNILSNFGAGSRICTPVTTFTGGTNWKQVSCSAGSYFVGAIKTDGTLWTWGRNNFGQLGINNTINRCTPVTTFAGGTDWKQVSCGDATMTAIKTDGTLWTWGWNNWGQLGNNTVITRSTPVTTFAGGTNWKQVACGGYHTSAIKTDGTLWTWGGYSPNNAQLGDNTTTNRSTPITTFAGGTNWKQVDCGGYHTSAIKTDGTLWVWGKNAYGNLGVGDANSRSTPVTTIAGGTNWKQVASGSAQTAAIKTSDDLQGI